MNNMENINNENINSNNYNNNIANDMPNQNSQTYTSSTAIALLLFGLFAPLIIGLISYFLIKEDDERFNRKLQNGKYLSSRILTGIIIGLLIDAVFVIIIAIVFAIFGTTFLNLIPSQA